MSECVQCKPKMSIQYLHYKSYGSVDRKKSLLGAINIRRESNRQPKWVNSWTNNTCLFRCPLFQTRILNHLELAIKYDHLFSVYGVYKEWQFRNIHNYSSGRISPYILYTKILPFSKMMEFCHTTKKDLRMTGLKRY